MSDTVSQKVARPARSALQGSTAWVLTEFVDSFFYDLSEKQYGAAVAMLTLVLSFVQVVVEDGIGKALLRDIPEPPAPPVDDAPGPVG